MKTLTKLTIILSAITIVLGYLTFVLNVISLKKSKRMERIVGE